MDAQDLPFHQQDTVHAELLTDSADVTNWGVNNTTSVRCGSRQVQVNSPSDVNNADDSNAGNTCNTNDPSSTSTTAYYNMAKDDEAFAYYSNKRKKRSLNHNIRDTKSSVGDELLQIRFKPRSRCFSRKSENDNRYSKLSKITENTYDTDDNMTKSNKRFSHRTFETKKHKYAHMRTNPLRAMFSRIENVFNPRKKYWWHAYSWRLLDHTAAFKQAIMYGKTEAEAQKYMTQISYIWVVSLSLLLGVLVNTRGELNRSESLTDHINKLKTEKPTNFTTDQNENFTSYRFEAYGLIASITLIELCVSCGILVVFTTILGWGVVYQTSAACHERNFKAFVNAILDVVDFNELMFSVAMILAGIVLVQTAHLRLYLWVVVDQGNRCASALHLIPQVLLFIFEMTMVIGNLASMQWLSMVSMYCGFFNEKPFIPKERLDSALKEDKEGLGFDQYILIREHMAHEVARHRKPNDAVNKFFKGFLRKEKVAEEKRNLISDANRKKEEHKAKLKSVNNVTAPDSPRKHGNAWGPGIAGLGVSEGEVFSGVAQTIMEMKTRDLKNLKDEKSPLKDSSADSNMISMISALKDAAEANQKAALEQTRAAEALNNAIEAFAKQNLKNS